MSFELVEWGRERKTAFLVDTQGLKRRYLRRGVRLKSASVKRHIFLTASLWSRFCCLLATPLRFN